MPALTLNGEGLLPVGVHTATLTEVEAAFVTGAPFESERRVVFEALALYARLVWARFPDARLWINGGFVTHKTWAAPKDADVAVVVPGGSSYDFNVHPEDLSLWTLQSVKASAHGFSLAAGRLQPMGGLIDAFFVPGDVQPALDYWRSWWQRLSVPGEMDRLDAKGFVEVVRP
jgi:hypothetical protein